MEYKDYYKIMGVERNSSPEEIKRAYRKLARKYHPDVSKEVGAEERFKELGEAYDVLKDPEKRAKYDQYGQYWKQQGQGQATHPGEGSSHQASYADYDTDDFNDFINSIFQQRQQQAQNNFYDTNQDIHAKLTITLEDSYHGAEKVLQLQQPTADHLGRISFKERLVKVKIPKGISDKQQIRLKGQGEKGRGQNQGDLYIEINISSHPLFKLDKKDIHLKLPIAPWEAALGASVHVPTLGGQVKLTIPKLSQTGKQMRLKGRGLPGQPAGDQYVSLEIVIPQTNQEELNKLYEQMSHVAHFNPRESLGVKHG